MSSIRSRLLWIIVSAVLSMATTAAIAQKNYSPGVTDTEIKIGQTGPYSGPASSYGTIGRAEAAYFEMINAQGGINGRKIRFISLDDAYTPSKTVEQTRRLVEGDEVFAIVGQMGTVTSAAVQKYLNSKGVPQILIASGSSKFDDPTNFPLSTELSAPSVMEGRIFARYLLDSKPDAKIGVLSQNDDAGADYVRGLKEGLGDRAPQMIVRELTFEVSDPTVDSQVVNLKAAGADTIYLMATRKAGAQAIRKVAELGWKPLFYVSSTMSSVEAVLKPAGLENSVGLLTAVAFKHPDDPLWKEDSDVVDYLSFLKQWYPAGSVADSGNVTGYVTAYVAAKIIERCGDDLTRENLIRQATTLNKLSAPLLLPGITITTTSTSYSPIHQMQLVRFNGKNWESEGKLISTLDPER